MGAVEVFSLLVLFLALLYIRSWLYEDEKTHDFYSVYGLQLAVRLRIRQLLFRGHQYTLVYRGFRGHTPSFIAARG